MTHSRVRRELFTCVLHPVAVAVQTQQALKRKDVSNTFVLYIFSWLTNG